MEIDSETMPSPPLAVHRETYIILVDLVDPVAQVDPVVPVDPVAQVDPIVPVDPVAPTDMPKDITVGHKSPDWARQTLQEVEGQNPSRNN
jgi:hypothetical protein